MKKLLFKRCPYCEKNFYTYYQEKNFCDDECEKFYNDLAKRKPKEENRHYNKERFSVYQCCHCAKMHTSKDLMYRFGMNSFCDTECAKARVAYNKKNLYNLNCRNCGEMFFSSNKAKYFFCCRECKKEHLNKD